MRRRDIGSAGGQRRSPSQRKRKRPARAMSAIQLSSLSLASASITGPTWVAGSRGSPTFSSRAAPLSMSSIASATSSCRQRSRSAEQRWPAERKADAITSSIDLLGQRGGVDDHGIDAAGLGDQRHDRTVLGGERAIDGAADFGRAGEDHAGDARIGDEARADGAVAGNEMQRARRHAGLMQQRDRTRGDQRRLFGRLGDDGIAGGERRGHLAEKDRQRKIPRADADEDAAAAIAQHIAFAGRSRHRLRRQARCAPARRNSGNSRQPRAVRRAHRRASCRLRSAAARAVRRDAARAGRRRARAPRRALRSGVAAQAGKPAAAAAIAARAIASSPSRTTPMARAVDRRHDRALDAGQRDAVDERRGFDDRRVPARTSRAARRGSRGRRTRCRPSCAAPADKGRAAAEFCGLRAALRRRRSSFAAGAECLRSARSDRRRPRRRTSWRRSPAAAAPDKRADRGDRRPAHRRGRQRPAIRPAALIERLAHAVSRWNSKPSTPPASSITLATVSALWVANCG